MKICRGSRGRSRSAFIILVYVEALLCTIDYRVGRFVTACEMWVTAKGADLYVELFLHQKLSGTIFLVMFSNSLSYFLLNLVPCYRAFLIEVN